MRLLCNTKYYAVLVQQCRFDHAYLELVMSGWGRRIRGAVGMGLCWAAGWAIGGVLIGVASKLLPGLPWDAFFDVFDAPLPALAIPGFFGGAFFSMVLGIAGRRRRLSEMSVARFAAYGAVGGLLLSLLPDALVAVGLAHLGDAETGPGLWKLTAMIAPPFILFSAASASLTLLLARRGPKLNPLEAMEETLELGHPDFSSPQIKSMSRKEKS